MNGIVGGRNEEWRRGGEGDGSGEKIARGETIPRTKTDRVNDPLFFLVAGGVLPLRGVAPPTFDIADCGPSGTARSHQGVRWLVSPRGWFPGTDDGSLAETLLIVRLPSTYPGQHPRGAASRRRGGVAGRRYGGCATAARRCDDAAARRHGGTAERRCGGAAKRRLGGSTERRQARRRGAVCA